MAKSELFPSLNEIIFASKDAGAIEREIISTYESLTDRTLARADPVRLFLESIALIIIQQRNIIDYTGKMNLLTYAEGDYLDHIGALFNVTRLSASSAVTTIEFTLSEVQASNVIIPSGTRISADGEILFSTSETLIIESGNLTGQVKAACNTTGTAGNGYLPGQLRRLVDVFPYEMQCANITESAGGSEIESDENYRERIQIAPESFTTAGSIGAYEYYARSANSEIGSVAVEGPPVTQPGNVNIYPLMSDGTLPPSEILEQVYESCNADDIRPDTDYVHVLSPEEREYVLNVTYYIDRSNASSASYISGQIESAIADWVTWQHNKLGRDINPSELNYRIIQAGAKRCEILSPEFTVLNSYEVGKCSESHITFGGLEDA